MGVSVNENSSLAGRVYSKYSTKAIDTDVKEDASSSYLDFDGYLKLLTAQMSNQDFNNSMSDSEFIQQMASYSTMEAISQLTKQTALSYNASLIGKAVTVSDQNNLPETGIVEAVSVTKDGCKLLVNGTLYSADRITDVVDGDIYRQLKTFVGHAIEVKDGDDTVTGKVTGILIKNGEGYVTLDNNQNYSLNSIVGVVDEEEKTENEDGEENAAAEDASATEDGSAGSAEVSENPSGSSNIGELSGTVYSSQAAYDTLLEMVDGANDDNGAIEVHMASVQNKMSRYLSMEVEGSDAASGLDGSGNRIPEPYTGSGAMNAQASQSAAASGLDGSGSRIPEPYGGAYAQSRPVQQAANSPERTVSAQTANASQSYDRGDVSGVTTVSGSEAVSTSVEQYMDENLYGYGDVPRSTRKYADRYPVEAAFADSVGTHMTDIRFIGNTSINSVIDTSSILCYSPSGRAVTDIGWCGRGRLGEVITFADGRQRVEVINDRDHVVHLYTSGNYTLDQICDFNCQPGEYAGKLTEFEIAIRHFAREYTAAEKEEMRSFGEYAVWHAATQYGNPAAAF